MSTQLRLIAAKIPVELYDQLDRYWHDARLPSRSVALRLAIEQLLDQATRKAARKAARRTRA